MSIRGSARANSHDPGPEAANWRRKRWSALASSNA
jgi:hypothetical protein